LKNVYSDRSGKKIIFGSHANISGELWLNHAVGVENSFTDFANLEPRQARLVVTLSWDGDIG
jgi:hypothetical protein